jgi:hypothetical protein
VRDGEFEQQLPERLELAEQGKPDAIALAEAKVMRGAALAFRTCGAPFCS